MRSPCGSASPGRWRRSPRPGAQAKRGSTVVITVSTGPGAPKSRQVPNASTWRVRGPPATPRRGFQGLARQGGVDNGVEERGDLHGPGGRIGQRHAARRRGDDLERAANVAVPTSSTAVDPATLLLQQRGFVVVPINCWCRRSRRGRCSSSTPRRARRRRAPRHADRCQAPRT